MIPEGALTENGLYCVLCRTPQFCIAAQWAEWSFSLEMELHILIDREDKSSLIYRLCRLNDTSFFIVQGEGVYCQISESSTLRHSLDHSLSYSYLHFEFTKKEPSPALK